VVSDTLCLPMDLRFTDARIAIAFLTMAPGSLPT
jgi:hypothetical protein